MICTEDAVPRGASAQHGWRALEAAGPLDFALTGLAAAITTPLGARRHLGAPGRDLRHGLLLRPGADARRAVAALEAAGHTVGTHS